MISTAPKLSKFLLYKLAVFIFRYELKPTACILRSDFYVSIVINNLLTINVAPELAKARFSNLLYSFSVTN